MRASKNSLSPTIQMRSSGFTLIELMVTIAVLAIIVGIAAPSISTQLANQRVKATANTLANALKEAKVESILRRQNIELSYSNNSTNGGTIMIEGGGSATVTTYRYDAKSTIKSTDDKIEFRPNKTADEMTFTICDTDANTTPRQITVTAIGVITSLSGGTC